MGGVERIKWIQHIYGPYSAAYAEIRLWPSKLTLPSEPAQPIIPDVFPPPLAAGARMNPKVLICRRHDEVDAVPLSSTVVPTPPETLRYDILDKQESKWRDLYHYLLERGFMLRPRYSLGWIPSWIGKSCEPWECEDAIEAFVRRGFIFVFHPLTFFSR